MQSVKLELTIDEINLILSILSEASYKTVNQIVQKLISKAQIQLSTKVVEDANVAKAN